MQNYLLTKSRNSGIIVSEREVMHNAKLKRE
nr:MAG TPA: hypothetical protein [Caudoviricetes sp.]